MITSLFNTLFMKKDHICAVLALFVINNVLHTQVGIGTSTPNASAALDITSSTHGLLIPQMITKRALTQNPGW
jgi:hypothetical protein